MEKVETKAAQVLNLRLDLLYHAETLSEALVKKEERSNAERLLTALDGIMSKDCGLTANRSGMFHTGSRTEGPSAAETDLMQL